LDSKGQECKSSGNASSMTGAGESSKDTGPMLPGFETCETATAKRWPTPREQDGKHGAVTEWERENRPADYLLHAAVAFRPLTSSAGASPASPSATPAADRENPIAAGFGLSSTESYARFNPDGSLLKMCQDYVQSTLDGSLEEYSGTFPKQGLMRSGRLYPLPTSERRISESESSLWHTPNAADAWVPSDPSPEAVENVLHRGHANQSRRTTYGSLAKQITWPTPMPSDVDGGRTTKGRHRQNETGLRRAVTTPTADDTGYRRQQYAQGGTALSTQIGGQLNPMWVEWLMGFPLGWTDLGDSATPSSRRSRK
jgi:hypothetical protein